MKIKLTKAERPTTTVSDLRPGQVFTFVNFDHDGSGIYMRVSTSVSSLVLDAVLYVNLESGYPYTNCTVNGAKEVVVIDDAVLTGTELS